MGSNSAILILLFFISTSACSFDSHNRPFFDALRPQTTPSLSRHLQPKSNGSFRIHLDFSAVEHELPNNTEIIRRMTRNAANYFSNGTPLVFSCDYIPFLQWIESAGGVSYNWDLSRLGNSGWVSNSRRFSGCTVSVLRTGSRNLSSNLRLNLVRDIRTDEREREVPIDIHVNRKYTPTKLHEFTHILGFSISLFPYYPSGWPLNQRKDAQGQTLYFISTEKVRGKVSTHFGCLQNQGLMLEDEESEIGNTKGMSSHWERKFVYNEYMTASSIKGAYASSITLALLDSTGWYSAVNYAFAEPSTFGKSKGCAFLDLSNCDFQEYCQVEKKKFGCDWVGTGEGLCRSDIYTNNCKLFRAFSNTVCVSDYFNSNNLNADMKAKEKGGSHSRCFESDFREKGIAASFFSLRCYLTKCSRSGKFLFVTVGQSLLICSDGQVLAAPEWEQFQGELSCPAHSRDYCDSKRGCAYDCNSKGLCIDGLCLCEGRTDLTPSCIDPNTLQDSGNFGEFRKLLNGETKTSREVICKQLLNCLSCGDQGCLTCSQSKQPINGICE